MTDGRQRCLGHPARMVWRPEEHNIPRETAEWAQGIRSGERAYTLLRSEDVMAEGVTTEDDIFEIIVNQVGR